MKKAWTDNEVQLLENMVSDQVKDRSLFEKDLGKPWAKIKAKALSLGFDIDYLPPLPRGRYAKQTKAIVAPKPKDPTPPTQQIKPILTSEVATDLAEKYEFVADFLLSRIIRKGEL